MPRPAYRFRQIRRRLTNAFNRVIVAEESPWAPSPRIADNASVKSPVETPFKYSKGMSASIVGERRM